jgi:DNA-binding response OmpR family regulator
LYEEFKAFAAEDGSKGVQAAKAGQIDLVIMDVGLPDIDGREAVRILRKNGFKAPIIMLTGHDTDSDTILGLDSGADDYITKPFRFAVLLARIRAQLRQHETSEDAVFHDRPVRVSARLEAAAQSQGQQGPLDREGELDPAVPLPRRPAAGVAGEAVARGLGLQLGSHHAHARDAHLSTTTKD